MNLTIATALALALQSSSGTTADAGSDADAPTTAEVIQMVVTQNFINMDRDKSGSLEAYEILAPVEEARQAAIAAADTDRDGKLTLAEYRSWLAPIIARQGEDWRKLAEGTFSGAGNDRALPPGNVAPSEAEVVLMTQTTFHNVDADNSGYIDGSESPIRASPGPQPVYRRDEDGNFVPTGERVVRTTDEIQAQFYQMADKDGDGRISYPEFHQWSAPNLVRNGIPAAWKKDMRRWMSPEG